VDLFRKEGRLFIGGRGRARGWPEVGAGAVSVEAAVAGRVGEAWAASAGVGVMSVARWSRRVTTDETGSSGVCGSSEGNSGRCRLAVSRPAGLRGQRGMVEGRVRRCGSRAHGLAGKGT
jgi:hypothetical protein